MFVRWVGGFASGAGVRSAEILFDFVIELRCNLGLVVRFAGFSILVCVIGSSGRGGVRMGGF